MDDVNAMDMHPSVLQISMKDSLVNSATIDKHRKFRSLDRSNFFFLLLLLLLLIVLLNQLTVNMGIKIDKHVRTIR